MSNNFVIVKVGDWFYDRELGKFLDHVQPTEQMYSVFEKELQKKSQDEKAILLAANITSDEFYDFANNCVRSYFNRTSQIGDIQYQLYDWLKDTGEPYFYSV